MMKEGLEEVLGPYVALTTNLETVVFGKLRRGLFDNGDGFMFVGAPRQQR